MSSESIIERRLHQECNYQSNSKMDIPICAICCGTLPSCSQQRSLNPEASAANKRVVDFLVSVINPELELAGGAGTAGGTRIQYCCKPYASWSWRGLFGDAITFNYALYDFVHQLTFQMTQVLLTRNLNQGTKRSFAWRVWTSGHETTLFLLYKLLTSELPNSRCPFSGPLK